MNGDRKKNQGRETNDTDSLTFEKTTLVPQFQLPSSKLLTLETRKALYYANIDLRELAEKTSQICPPLKDADLEGAIAIRNQEAELFYRSPLYAGMTERYKVSVTTEEIAGINTEVFVPADSTPDANKERILINLHGGGFLHGARTYSHLESIPICAVGGFKVISIDYRMAPGYQHPAGRDDAVAVYQALLQQYRPENIGIFGCSAGGLLTAQSIAWLQQEGIPLPGAVAMSCAAGYYWAAGDSGYIASGIAGYPLEECHENAYFAEEDENDPLVFPGNSPEILAKFPPSLLIASTRDFSLSSVVRTHSELVKLGVEANLHIWEGLDHAFLMLPDLPESREAYSVIVNFFNKHLA